MPKTSDDMTDEEFVEWLFKIPAPKPKRKRASQVEKNVLKKCSDVLTRHPDVIDWERRTTGVFKRGPRYVRTGRVGAPDLWCVLKDQRHLEIECKRRDGKGRYGPDQEKFRDDCLGRGGLWVGVKNEKELADYLNGLDIK